MKEGALTFFSYRKGRGGGSSRRNLYSEKTSAPSPGKKRQWKNAFPLSGEVSLSLSNRGKRRGKSRGSKAFPRHGKRKKRRRSSSSINMR